MDLTGKPQGAGGSKPKRTAKKKAAGKKLPKLSYKTISGPTPRKCGGFKWVVQWKLDKKSPKGGWIVQKVEMPYNVTDCKGKTIKSKKTKRYPLWEAWRVNKGKSVTNYAEKGDKEDDTYATNGPPRRMTSKGTMSVKGTAEFYEGLKLPKSFKVTNKTPTWSLPATRTAPTLSGGTGSIPHTLKASWDCCSKAKGASKMPKITTV